MAYLLTLFLTGGPSSRPRAGESFAEPWGLLRVCHWAPTHRPMDRPSGPIKIWSQLSGVSLPLTLHLGQIICLEWNTPKIPSPALPHTPWQWYVPHTTTVPLPRGRDCSSVRPAAPPSLQDDMDTGPSGPEENIREQ